MSNTLAYSIQFVFDTNACIVITIHIFAIKLWWGITMIKITLKFQSLLHLAETLAYSIQFMHVYQSQLTFLQ